MKNNTFYETEEAIVVIAFGNATLKTARPVESKSRVYAPVKQELHFGDLVFCKDDYAIDELGNEYIIDGNTIMDSSGEIKYFKDRDEVEVYISAIAEIKKYGKIILDRVFDEHLVMFHLIKEYFVKCINASQYLIMQEGGEF